MHFGIFVTERWCGEVSVNGAIVMAAPRPKAELRDVEIV